MEGALRELKRPCRLPHRNVVLLHHLHSGAHLRLARGKCQYHRRQPVRRARRSRTRINIGRRYHGRGRHGSRRRTTTSRGTTNTGTTAHDAPAVRHHGRTTANGKRTFALATATGSCKKPQHPPARAHGRRMCPWRRHANANARPGHGRVQPQRRQRRGRTNRGSRRTRNVAHRPQRPVLVDHGHIVPAAATATTAATATAATVVTPIPATVLT